MKTTDEIYLIQLLDKTALTAFKWGQNDCNTLCVEWVDRVCGTDYLSRIKNNYQTKKGAVRFYRGFVEWMTELKELGWQEVEKPQTGDLVLHLDKSFVFAHVFVSGKMFSVDPEKGLVAGLPVPDVDYKVMRFN
jgi:hypothetical protein